MASIFKFVLTPSAMIIAPNDWSFLEIVVIVGSGASLGVAIFYFFGDKIFSYLDSKRKNAPKRFTRFNRFITKVKMRYGLKGLLLLCGLISVPISSLLAARYFRSDTTLPLLVMSFWIWAVFLTSISYLIRWLF
ncbi:MAG: hypothetical protein HKN32_05775 [Flavobacteriales bacterium]|nr:hypothetical protein [Flavobacteriales bacterium]